MSDASPKSARVLRFPILPPGASAPTSSTDPGLTLALATALLGLSRDDLARLRLSPSEAAYREGALSLSLTGPGDFTVVVEARPRDEGRAAFLRTGGLDLSYRSSAELPLCAQLTTRAARALRGRGPERLARLWSESVLSNLSQINGEALEGTFGDAGLARHFGDTACGMMGSLDLLSELQGEFAVIVHGDRPCLMRGEVGSSRFYTSDLQDVDVVTGGGERLHEAAAYVMAEAAPEALVLVSTCLSQMIGEDIEGLADDLEAEHGLPVIPLRVSGLEPLLPFQVADRVHGALARRFVEERETRAGSVAFVGYPNEGERFRRELRAALEAAGLSLGVFWPDDDLADLSHLGAAELVFAPERTGFRRLLRVVERETRARVVIQESPIGVQASAAFYRRVGVEAGREAELEAAIAPREERARARVARFRARSEGARVAVCFGNNRKGVIAASFMHLGLGYVPLLLELGLEPVLMAVTEESAEQHARVRALAESLGTSGEIHLYRRPERLPSLLREAKVVAAFTEDCHKHYVDAAEIAYLGFRAFRCGFDAIGPVVDTLEALLR